MQKVILNVKQQVYFIIKLMKNNILSCKLLHFWKNLLHLDNLTFNKKSPISHDEIKIT